MGKPSDIWSPTTIKRFVKAFSTSACTVVVETDAGKGYLKAMGNHEGPHILACELVATQLARWFELPTFDFAIIEVTDIDEIPFHDGTKAEVGPAFITRAESGDVWSGDKGQLAKLFNPQDISRLVVFDTWTLNCDRYSEPRGSPARKPRVNRNNVFLSEEAPAGQFLLKAMDHTHCFTCGKTLTKRLAEFDMIREERVFGLFPEFREYLDRQHVRQAAAELKKITRAKIGKMTQLIPRQWDVPADAIDALVQFAVDRAKYVADNIEDRLFPERELDFGDDESTEPTP